ncbi:CopM family metallochaperone [Paragemmobacter ruber]|uniref:DUF305 domain-containing protein n=1 Tax=Paragemmobacter ruber TaxID=1985673 RepID=A0ABW9Y9F3_9RHOB|nr:DUF305 domain-containing protein [Rhodobacter ruber]NBE09027.1 DUF305 domain-containing protein [Rhodobacter ruber]
MSRALILSVALLAAAPLAAQEAGHGGHGGHGDHAGSMMGEEAPSTQAYRAANDRMHAGMGIAFTGDADVDFVRGMIAHHQGAIDMARVVLEHGDDPQVKKLAEEIIAAQEAEIGWMTEWLAKNGG